MLQELKEDVLDPIRRVVDLTKEWLVHTRQYNYLPYEVRSRVYALGHNASLLGRNDFSQDRLKARNSRHCTS